MAGNRSHFQFSKSVVATSLIALGILILGANLTAAATDFSRTVGWNSADAQSLGPVALLALGVPTPFRTSCEVGTMYWYRCGRCSLS